jgi:hypothetical protein
MSSRSVTRTQVRRRGSRRRSAEREPRSGRRLRIRLAMAWSLTTARASSLPAQRAQAFTSHVEGPREQRGPRHVRGGSEEGAAADASEVSGRQDVRHRDVGPVEAACEGRRGNRHRGRDDGPGLVARRWPLPCLAPRLAWVGKPRRRRGACARRAPGQPRQDARPELRARREDAVETRQRVARRWNRGAQPRDALNRRHDPAARDAPRRLLHAVGDAAVPQDAEARERTRFAIPEGVEGWTKAVPAKSFSAEIIVGVDGEARVQVEAVTRDGFVDERSRGLGRAVALAGVVLDVQGGAALRGEQGPHLGEGAALRVVRGVVVVLRVAALAKPRHHAQRDPLGEVLRALARIHAPSRSCRGSARASTCTSICTRAPGLRRRGFRRASRRLEKALVLYAKSAKPPVPPWPDDVPDPGPCGTR